MVIWNQSVYRLKSTESWVECIWYISINLDYKMVRLTIVSTNQSRSDSNSKSCSCQYNCFIWVYVCPTGSETLLSSPLSLHTCYQVSDTCSLAYFTLNRQHHYLILTVIKALRWLVFKFQTVCFANTLLLLMDNSITIYLSLFLKSNSSF